MVTLEHALEEAKKKDRVCPQPQKWNELYQMLPNKQRKGGGWNPSLPLILAAWHDTPDMLKILRLREHLEWASEHNCLDAIYEFMVGMSEDDWHHVGD